jgi:outer membrane receptor for Fe3+-dicitrate
MTIVAEKAGTYYYPVINVTNIRVQKEFVIRNTQRLQLMLNLNNFFDAQTVTSVNQLTGNFGYPIGHLGGTVVRFSARYSF